MVPAEWNRWWIKSTIEFKWWSTARTSSSVHRVRRWNKSLLILPFSFFISSFSSPFSFGGSKRETHSRTMNETSGLSSSDSRLGACFWKQLKVRQSRSRTWAQVVDEPKTSWLQIPIVYLKLFVLMAACFWRSRSGVTAQAVAETRIVRLNDHLEDHRCMKLREFLKTKCVWQMGDLCKQRARFLVVETFMKLHFTRWQCRLRETSASTCEHLTRSPNGNDFVNLHNVAIFV